MTSLLSSYAPRKEGFTRFQKPESPCYDDTGLGRRVLFPFSYSNGILDISYQGNTFEADMVTTTGQPPLSETDTAIQVLSGPYLVTSLGNNFKAYIRAWRTATIDADSPITIYVAPQMFKVQEAEFTNISADSGDSYKISTRPPAGDNYTTGSIANQYRTVYVFKTPLTFTIVESAVTKYITFRTMMDQE